MEIKKIIKGVLFDLDHTILDLPIDYDSLRHDLCGLASTYGVVSGFRHILEEINRIASSLPLQSSKEFLNSCYKIIDRYELEAANRATPVEGSPILARSLKSKGYGLAIISRNSINCVKASLIHTEMIQHFDVLVGRESTARTKPDPAPIIFCLERMGLQPTEAVFVGDHRYDAIAASGAGMKFVFFGAIPHFKPQPPIRIEKLEQLARLLDEGI